MCPVREYSYNENYAELFKGLIEIKTHIQKTYPGVTFTPMYNLHEEREKVHILTSYSDMGEYQRVNDLMDKDEKSAAFYTKNMRNLNSDIPPVDHFFRGIT